MSVITKHEIEVRHKSYYGDEDHDFCMHCLLEDAQDVLTKLDFHITDHVMCDQIITIWIDGDIDKLEASYPWEVYDNMIFIYPTDQFEITYKVKK